MFAFLSKLLDSVLSSQVSNFIKQGFLRLGRKLKSNKLINRILGYFIGLGKYSRAYRSKEEVKSVTHYLKLSHNDEGWWRELQDKYSESIKKGWMPYDTEIESINHAKKELKGFTVLDHVDRYSMFRDEYNIYSISAPHLVKKK